MEGRNQYVEIEYLECNKVTSVSSSINDVRYSVPHRSIKGPLLFLVYLTGLPSVIERPTEDCHYTDDIKVGISGKSKLYIEINEIPTVIVLSDTTQYRHNNNLLPNPTQTKYITFSSTIQTHT